jgi:hypothetical protein
MTLKKEMEPLVSGITRSPQNATESRPFKVVGKYTNYTIEIPLNFEIVLINGMEAIFIISKNMKGFSTGAFAAFAAFFMNTLL